MESWWLNGMVPYLAQTAGSSKANPPRGRQRRTPLNPLGHVYISAAYTSPIPLSTLPDPGAAVPADLPCPSRNLTGQGSTEVRSENITSSDERWRKMKTLVDIGDASRAEISPAASSRRRIKIRLCPTDGSMHYIMVIIKCIQHCREFN